MVRTEALAGLMKIWAEGRLGVAAGDVLFDVRDRRRIWAYIPRPPAADFLIRVDPSAFMNFEPEAIVAFLESHRADLLAWPPNQDTAGVKIERGLLGQLTGHPIK